MPNTFSKIAVTSVIILLLFSVIVYLTSSKREVVISTTTSLYASGLLDYIEDRFNELYPDIKLKIIPLGSGAALESAARGDANIVLVHAPNLEKEYLHRGVLINGSIIAYNYFIVVGPKNDPAGISNASDITEVFKRIYMLGEKGKVKFISRGDKSGTHIRELMIWDAVGIDPEGPWYIESGSGMGETLLMANELSAYTLSDIGTYLIFSEKGRINNLTKLFEKDGKLLNIYSIYLVKDRNSEEAVIFYNFIIENISSLINEFNQKEGGKYFYPIESFQGDLYQAWKQFSTGILP